MDRPMDRVGEKKWLSDDVFIFFKNGIAYLWDYQRHQQYEIDAEEFSRLLAFSKGAYTEPTTVDRSITRSGVLVDTPPNPCWGWDLLSKIFHLGTSHPHAPTHSSPARHRAYTQSYLAFCQEISKAAPGLHVRKSSSTIGLPPPDLHDVANAGLWDTLLSRQTCREFYDMEVPHTLFSTLLAGTLGAVDRQDHDLPRGVQPFGYKRTSPSAGGLQATEGYIWVRKVEGIQPGIYHYLSEWHGLEKVTDLPEEPLSTYLCNQHWSDLLGFAVFLVARMDVLWWKYPHSRAYRPLLIDSGHLSQTFNLLATAVGLKSWMTGYFHDKEINDLLGLKVPQEQVIFMIGAGHGSGSAYDPIARSVLDEAGR